MAQQLPAGGSSSGAARGIEVFGFAGWAASYAALACYTAWSLLPAPYLHAIGITYYPSRLWALVIPFWGLVLAFFCFWMYEGLNQVDVAPFPSTTTVRDGHSKDYRRLGLPGVTVGRGGGVLPLVHIDPAVVSRVLYCEEPVQEALRKGSSRVESGGA